jgi:hypothetical protein
LQAFSTNRDAVWGATRRAEMANSPVGWLALLHLGLIVSGLAYGLYFSAALDVAK